MNYYCAKFYTNISINMDITNIFQFLSIFAQNFYYFSLKKSNFGPNQLDIIAYIVSKAMNYNYAKLHAFIKKLTNNVIFRRLWRISCVVSWPSPHFLCVEHCSPPCIKTPLIQIMSYIYTHL